jgi:hypothetical protein
VLALLLVLAGAARGQLEVLLRGLEPAPPRPGACGQYRFVAQEAGGVRRVEFRGCIESVGRGPSGSVFLRLTSGDSLDARLEVGPALFQGQGGALADHVRSVVEIAGRDTTRLARRDWAETPGLARAPALPNARESALGSRSFEIGARTLAARGRRLHEESRQVRPLGNVQMTQSEVRDVEVWTSSEAPILGLVRATAVIRSERQLSAPVAGVPQRGPREVRYELELIGFGSPTRSQR